MVYFSYNSKFIKNFKDACTVTYHIDRHLSIKHPSWDFLCPISNFQASDLYFQLPANCLTKCHVIARFQPHEILYPKIIKMECEFSSHNDSLLNKKRSSTTEP